MIASSFWYLTKESDLIPVSIWVRTKLTSRELLFEIVVVCVRCNFYVLTLALNE